MQTAVNVDLQGYFTAVSGNSDAASGGFVPLDQVPALDYVTVAAGATRNVSVSNIVGPDAASIFAGLSLRNVEADGTLTQVLPDGTSGYPLVNFAVGGPNDAAAAIPISGGEFKLRNTSSQSVTLTVNVQGYFSASTREGGGFRSLAPTSVYDATVPAGASRTFGLGGMGTIPTYGASGVMMLFRSSEASGSGFGNLSASRGGRPVSDLPILGWRAGGDLVSTSSTAVVRPGDNGTITIVNRSSQSAARIQITAVGWFAADAFVQNEQQAFIDGAMASGYTEDWAQQAIFDREMAEATVVEVQQTNAESAEQDWSPSFTDSPPSTMNAASSSSSDGETDQGAAEEELAEEEEISDNNSAEYAGSLCRNIEGTVTGKNLIGRVMWTFTQVTDYCFRGGRLTFKNSYYRQTSPGFSWDFKKITSSSSAGRNPWTRYRQAKFQQCFPTSPVTGPYCPHTASPWVRHRVWGNGNATQDGGA